MKRIYIVAFVLIYSLLSASASPRSRVALADAAFRAIHHSGHQKKAHSSKELILLASAASYSIYGYSGGGYAVVASDDLLPEVLGCGEGQYVQGKNTALEWWLKAIDEVATDMVVNGKAYVPILPDGNYQAAVTPMLTSLWGQEEPYNNMCPPGTYGYGESRSLTGCVATAVAQIMRYYKFPEHGQGTAFVYVPAGSINGRKYSVDFFEDYYDWDNMLDSYSRGYNIQQADAVALLMYDCGVAFNMNYSPSASGAFTKDAAQGLRQFFGYTKATMKERKNFSDEEWMEMVYGNLSDGKPLYYGANDIISGGHAFCIDGYREDGFVHVNWGWEGENNGYYDISLLNPKNYQFSENQDMIVDIMPDVVHDRIEKNIENTSAGNLSNSIPDNECDYIWKLNVKGPIDASDMAFIRSLSGINADGEKTTGMLQYLDLSDAELVAGYEPFFVSGNNSYKIDRTDMIPSRAFAGCDKLKDITLPKNMVAIGDGVFSGDVNLERVNMPMEGALEYQREGNIIYSADKSELISVLPFEQAPSFNFDRSLKVIHDYAFENSSRLYSLVLPSSLTTIGERAFANCQSLRNIQVFATTPPAASASAFEDNKHYSILLYVRRGYKDAYKASDVWKDFAGTYMNGGVLVDFDNIHEFGTELKVTNAYREYGDTNPKFGYKLIGDALSGGKPELTCEADQISPVGEYVIHISEGTITDEAVTYTPGILFVMPSTLSVKCGEYTKEEGTENPEFTLEYVGFKNEDNESLLLKAPVITTTANKNSTVGDYVLQVSGGEDSNYEFEYKNGILHVIPSTSGIVNVETENEQTTYNLQGMPVENTTGLKVVIRNGRKKLQ